MTTPAATLEYRGKLVHRFRAAGESGTDGVFPRHVGGLQLSRDRFLLLLTSGGWRGSDDNRGTLYQIRAGGYDGELLCEGVLRATTDDWDARADGRVYSSQTIGPLGFGVPAGALIDGKVPAHAGLFTFMWKRVARPLDPDTGWLALETVEEVRNRLDATALVEWTQLRFDPATDAFAPVVAVQPLRQKGYESGYPCCERAEIRRLITGMANPVPIDGDATRWMAPMTVFCPSTERVACLEFSYDPDAGRYQWTRTGPVSAEGLWEPCPMRLRDGDWAISARVRPAFRRPEGGVAWLRAADPLTELPQPVHVDVPSPGLQTAFRCADGVIRIYSNDSRVRPGWPGMRNPLYQWEVDPEQGFAVGEPQVVFDSVDWKMPIRDEAKTVVDQAKVLLHAGGDRQTVVHRLRTFALADPAHAGVAVNAAEREAHGIYYSELVFDRAYPGEWEFAANTGG